MKILVSLPAVAAGKVKMRGRKTRVLEGGLQAGLFILPTEYNTPQNVPCPSSWTPLKEWLPCTVAFGQLLSLPALKLFACSRWSWFPGNLASTIFAMSQFLYVS